MSQMLKVVLFWPVAISLGFVAVSLMAAASGWLERRERRRGPHWWGQ